MASKKDQSASANSQDGSDTVAFSHQMVLRQNQTRDINQKPGTQPQMINGQPVLNTRGQYTAASHHYGNSDFEEMNSRLSHSRPLQAVGSFGQRNSAELGTQEVKPPPTVETNATNENDKVQKNRSSMLKTQVFARSDHTRARSLQGSLAIATKSNNATPDIPSQIGAQTQPLVNRISSYAQEYIDSKTNSRIPNNNDLNQISLNSSSKNPTLPGPIESGERSMTVQPLRGVTQIKIQKNYIKRNDQGFKQDKNQTHSVSPKTLVEDQQSPLKVQDYIMSIQGSTIAGPNSDPNSKMVSKVNSKDDTAFSIGPDKHTKTGGGILPKKEKSMDQRRFKKNVTGLIANGPQDMSIFGYTAPNGAAQDNSYALQQDTLVMIDQANIVARNQSNFNASTIYSSKHLGHLPESPTDIRLQPMIQSMMQNQSKANEGRSRQTLNQIYTNTSEQRESLMQQMNAMVKQQSHGGYTISGQGNLADFTELEQRVYTATQKDGDQIIKGLKQNNSDHAYGYQSKHKSLAGKKRKKGKNLVQHFIGGDKSSAAIMHKTRFNSTEELLNKTVKKTRTGVTSPNQVTSPKSGKGTRGSKKVRHITCNLVEFPNLINLTKVTDIPLKRFDQYLEAHVEGEPSPTKLVRPESLKFFGELEELPPPKKGVFSLNSVQINDLYQNQQLHEFEYDHLLKLLGSSNARGVDANYAETERSSQNERRYFLKFNTFHIVAKNCKSGLMDEKTVFHVPFSKIPKLYFLSKNQVLQVVSESMQLQRREGKIKLHLNINKLRERLDTVEPMGVRDEYSHADLRVRIMANIHDSQILRDEFNIQIQMPSFEILRMCDELNSQRGPKKPPIFKTTVMHFITAREMLSLFRQYHLTHWVDLAFELIKDRRFGVNQSLMEGVLERKYQKLVDCFFVPYLKQKPSLDDKLRIDDLQKLITHDHQIEANFEFLKPAQIRLKSKRHQDEIWRLADIQSDGEFSPTRKKEETYSKFASFTVAKMEIMPHRLEYLATVFGQKLDKEPLDALQCINQVINVLIDEEQEVIRLKVPSWKKIELLHMKHMTSRIYEEQQAANQSATNNMVYLQRMTGLKPYTPLSSNSHTSQIPKTVKSQITSQKTSKANQQKQESFQSAVLQGFDYAEDMLEGRPQTETQQMPPGIKTLRVNDKMDCYLKLVGPTKIISKTKFESLDFNESDFDGTSETKVTLEENLNFNKVLAQ